MNFLNEFSAAYPVAVWCLAVLVITAILVSVFWDHVSWWWMNTWYSFPVIGKISRLSKDNNRTSTDENWFKGERALCQDYKSRIKIQSEYEFNQAINYLNKAGDNGRHSTPILIWILTAALVFVEAMGFSYVLAGYTIPGASESTQSLAANGIAFIISVIAIVLTHLAGHELYKSVKIRNARNEWIGSGKQNKLWSRSVMISQPQQIDDDEPAYAQLTNRVGYLPSYVVGYATIAFVLIIAIGATWVRVQTANKMLNEAASIQKSEINSPKSTEMSLDMNAKSGVLPDADVKSSRGADEKAVDDGTNIDREAYWVTFVMLAFLFIFLQIISVMFGYRWGFAGKNSPEAYARLGRGRYVTYTDAVEACQKVVDKAQSKLEDLQQRMMSRHGEIGTEQGFHTKKTFPDYLDEAGTKADAQRELSREAAAAREALEMQQLTTERRLTAARKALTDAEKSKPIPATPVTAPGPNRELDLNPTPVIATELTAVDRAVAHLDGMGEDKAAKTAYAESLSSDVYDAVLESLKVRKQSQETARKNRKAEIENLL